MKPSHAFAGFIGAHPLIAASITVHYANLPPEIRAALGSAVAFGLAKIVKTLADIIADRLRRRAGLIPENTDTEVPL